MSWNYLLFIDEVALGASADHRAAASGAQLKTTSAARLRKD
ncbi:hypothetical protein BSIN_0054 [Burkholderia singularis]|uniref:Uncharacterized protein n=1 Tax=Burkholderia singularis TaxID=1503053 RepID=A0A238H244_9BURK|nr:hypothetical protein BSIN_0054 [Burkholderia singularis]